MAFAFNAILKFNSSGAEAALTRTKTKFNDLKSSISKAGASLNKVGQGIRGAAIAATPLTVGVAFATKTAADFEEQLSIVRSVLLATPKEMEGLNEVTKRLGATTAFTAKQAGEGAEFLARAGFTSQQIIEALPGVLDAAAASGAGLADAADIVAGQLGAFARPASDAGKVADALSLTTALTNTNFIQLGEAMKFAAPIAKNVGLSLEETASAMGILANAGVKGSLAGTALKNALLKLSTPSKEAIKLFGGKNGLEQATLRVVNGQKKLLPIEVIMANVAKAVQRAKDPLEATAAAAEIFGIRGATAFGAFQSKLTETTVINEKNFDSIKKGAQLVGENIDVAIGKEIPTLVALRLQLAGAEGTAKKMAQIRLDNLKGQFTLFTSAVSGLAIEVGSLVTGPLKNLVSVGTDFFSIMAEGFQTASRGGNATAEQLTKSFAGIPFQDFLDFAKGFIEGFEEVKTAAKEVFNDIVDFLKPILGDSNLTAKEFGKLAAKIISIGAVAAPVLGSIAAGLFVLGPIITGIVGAFQFLGAVFGIVSGIAQVAFGIIATVVGAVSAPVLGIIAAVVAVGAAFYIFRDEIASVFTFIWQKISQTFEPFVPLIKFVAGVAQVIFQETANFIVAVFEPLGSFFSKLWTGIVNLAATAFNGLINNVINPIVGTLKNIFSTVGGFIFDSLTFPFRGVISIIKKVIASIADTTLGKKALQIAGIDATSLKQSLAALPTLENSPAFAVRAVAETPSPITNVATKPTSPALTQTAPKAIAEIPSAKVIELRPQTAPTGVENQKIAAASVQQRAITAPLDKERIIAAARRAQPAPQIQQSNSGPMRLSGELVTKISGKDLNIILTRAQIENAEANGRSVDPLTKRRSLQNGLAFGVK